MPAVSGTVMVSGAPVAGVLVNSGPLSATTNASGQYTIDNLPNGNYTITPILTGFTFSPTNVTVSGSSLIGINFTGTINPVTFGPDNVPLYSELTAELWNPVWESVS